MIQFIYDRAGPCTKVAWKIAKVTNGAHVGLGNDSSSLNTNDLEGGQEQVPAPSTGKPQRLRKRPQVVTPRWMLSRVLLYALAFAAVVGTYLHAVCSFVGSATRISDTVAATGVLFSALTLEFVAFQIDIALQIARTQNDLIEEQTKIAEDELLIANQQTTILARQDEVSNRKAYLTLHTRRYPVPVNFGAWAELYIVNDGNRTATSAKVVLYLLAGFGVSIDMQNNGWQLKSPSDRAEFPAMCERDFDVNFYPRYATNLPRVEFATPPNTQPGEVYYRLVYEDGATPSLDKVAPLPRPA